MNVHYMFDHSNAFTAWQKMDSPAQPTADQYEQLEKAGRLRQVGSAEVINVNKLAVFTPLAMFTEQIGRAHV